MSWIAVGSAAVTLVGGYLSKRAANKGAQQGADAAAAAEMAGIEEQRRQYDLTRSDMAPWMQAGAGALGKQQAFLGGDWSGFMNSPDYKYALDQGIGNMDKSAASRGSLFSGGHQRDLSQFNQGMALQNANGYWGKLAGLSSTGNNTAGSLGQFGANMANGISNSYTNIGNARRSSYNQMGQNNADFWAGTANTLGGLWGNNAGNRGWG